jgi:protein phosphatase
MLRIAEQWYATDVGRQRQGNEDNFFVRAPLFVVADGMGGAQAGEVASEMAVRSFRGGLPDGAATEGLVRVIESANQAIHERSRAEEQRAGMGTTVTAAYVAEDEVVVAHVGDSRAYLLRDSELVRLTRDHSLVDELFRQGKITEEQIEHHPQRSVITRALGPEPHVQVDVDRFPARAGDVFLLCSDGLTSMVPEKQLLPLLTEASSLEAAGKELIASANAAGGRDNITVVLFRLEAVDPAVAGAGTTGGALTQQHETAEFAPFAGETAPGADAPTEVGERALRTEDVARAVEERGGRTTTGTAALILPKSASTPSAEPGPDSAARAPGRDGDRKRRRRRRLRVGAGGVLALAFALILLIAGWMATRAVYFVGADAAAGGAVTIYRGLPYELPAGIRLYERYAGSGVTLDAVPQSRRAVFTDHKLRSKDDAESLVIQLERGQLER